MMKLQASHRSQLAQLAQHSTLGRMLPVRASSALRRTTLTFISFVTGHQSDPPAHPSGTDDLVARRRRRLVLRHLPALLEARRFIVAEH